MKKMVVMGGQVLYDYDMHSIYLEVMRNLHWPFCSCYFVLFSEICCVMHLSSQPFLSFFAYQAFCHSLTFGLTCTDEKLIFNRLTFPRPNFFD